MIISLRAGSTSTRRIWRAELLKEPGVAEAAVVGLPSRKWGVKPGRLRGAEGTVRATRRRFLRRSTRGSGNDPAGSRRCTRSPKCPPAISASC